MHLRAFIETQSLKDMPKMVDVSVRLAMLGFAVTSEYFMEKQRWRRWACFFKWKRPFW